MSGGVLDPHLATHSFHCLFLFLDFGEQIMTHESYVRWSFRLLRSQRYHLSNYININKVLFLESALLFTSFPTDL
jgi:hypothetical protein